MAHFSAAQGHLNKRLGLFSGTHTVSTNGNAISGIGVFSQALVFLNVTAASGTSPSLTVKIQSSDDGGMTWYDIPGAAFSAKTAAGNECIKLDNFGDTIRFVSTITGTTPSFTYTVNAVFKS